MYFQHSSEIWRDYPELVPGVLFAEGIHKDVSVGPRVAKFDRIAEERLATASEAELPQIQAWRLAFRETHRGAQWGAQPHLVGHPELRGADPALATLRFLIGSALRGSGRRRAP